MKSLITGGAGFIGSHFARQLLSEQNQEIVILDSLRYSGSLSNIRDFQNRIRFVRIDIRDNEAVRILFAENEFDSVINFAAETHVDNSIDTPGIFAETNFLGMFNLLEACVQFKTKLFFQISTDEVYGSINQGLYKECDKFNPSSPYAATKAAAELLLQSFAQTYSLNFLIARCSNNFGPAQYPEKFIPVAIKYLMSGGNVPVYGNGRNIREWIYVTDTCSALIQILLLGEYGEVYNVSSGDFRSNIEIVQKLSELLGITENRINFVQDRAGHDFRYAIDSTKIQKNLGWKREVAFDEGMFKTVDWYQKNFKRFKAW